MALLSSLNKIKKENQSSTIVTGADDGNEKSSKKLGNEFEREISNVCSIYRSLKIAVIQQFPTEMVWVPKRNIPGGGTFGGFFVPKKQQHQKYDFCDFCKKK